MENELTKNEELELDRMISEFFKKLANVIVKYVIQFDLPKVEPMRDCSNIQLCYFDKAKDE